MTREFYVSPENLPAVKRAIARAQSKVSGLTVECLPVMKTKCYIYEEIEGTYGHRELIQVGTYPRMLHKIMVELDYDRAMANGYRLIAMRTLDPAGGDFIEWYGEKSELTLPQRVCQHCNRNQARSQTFIVESPTGERIQVGGSCRAIYIPAEALAYVTEMQTLLYRITPLNEWTDRPEMVGAPREEMHRVESVIAHSLHQLRNHPWVPSTDEWGQSNADATWRAVFDKVRRVSLETSNVTPWCPEVYTCLADLRAGDYNAPDLEYDYTNRKLIAMIPSAVKRWLTERVRREQPTVEQIMPPTGRTTLTGTVLSVKQVDSEWGITIKTLIDCGGFKVYGSCPVLKCSTVGDRVTFQANVQPKEVGFGFYSRPTKGVIL